MDIDMKPLHFIFFQVNRLQTNLDASRQVDFLLLSPVNADDSATLARCPDGDTKDKTRMTHFDRYLVGLNCQVAKETKRTSYVITDFYALFSLVKK